MTDRLGESFRFCRTLTRQTAGNFGYAFWALPWEQRRAMDALYAFMRMTDDIGDNPQSAPAQRVEQLARWRTDLQQTLQDRLPDHPVWPAVREIARRYHIPETYFTDVIDGVEMDLAPRTFATFAELSDYCYHVAGAVGLCCIRIWGYRGDRAEALAVDCGLAFQLTNILRDLAEDAALGRIYLPREDLERFGYSADDLWHQRWNREFRNLMAFETERAWFYYRRSEPLLNDLEPAGKPVLRAMREIYGGLLHEIERRTFDVFTRRIRLPVWRKLWIAGKALSSKPRSAPKLSHSG
jgi:phytoene synthase